MRILVFTHFSVPNFGANLQAYATNRLFKNIGITPEYINYMPTRLKEIYQGLVSPSQAIAHKRFIINHLSKISPEFTKTTEVYDYINKCNPDFLATGSDAVFRLRSDGVDDLKYPNPYWLPFPNSIGKKISIAPSAMGANLRDSIPSKLQSNFSQNLKEYKLLTCRDNWTRKQLSHFNNVQAEIFLDPVFHLRDIELQSKKLPYICINLPKALSGKFESSLCTLIEAKGFRVIHLPNPENIIEPTSLDPWDWYKTIAESSGYIGVRFHPIVTCISRGIPFVALDQYSRHPLENVKSKTFDMAKQFGLQKFCLSKLEQKLYSPKNILRLLMHFKAPLGIEQKISLRCKNEAESLYNTIHN